MIAWQALIWGPMAAHSFVWVRIHCVWTTYRRQSLLDPDWRERMYRYLAGVASRKGALLLCAGGVRDHIHLYLSLPPDRSIASLVNALKQTPLDGFTRHSRTSVCSPGKR